MEGMDDMSQPSDEGLIQRLKVAWRNERCSPELLPAEQVLVDKVMNLVEAQERQIEEQWEAENKEESVRIAMALQQLELDRIRFMLRSYLRARLNKVEKYTTYYLDNSKVDCLSDNERSFAIRYKEMIERHFEVSLLNEIPEKLRSLETVTTEINMVPKPDLTAHVFCLVQENLPPIDLGQHYDPLDLQKDDVYMTRYELVKEFVESNRIVLI